MWVVWQTIGLYVGCATQRRRCNNPAIIHRWRAQLGALLKYSCCVAVACNNSAVAEAPALIGSILSSHLSVDVFHRLSTSYIAHITVVNIVIGCATHAAGGSIDCIQATELLLHALQRTHTDKHTKTRTHTHVHARRYRSKFEIWQCLYNT